MSMTSKKIVKSIALASVLIASGCGYSDYPGHPGHKTQKEAYVPAWSTVVSGYGEYYDGTYVYSVKYNNRNWQSDNFNFNVKITSYRNKVTDSYPHRPNVFPDADNFQRATGFAGGEFGRYWIANDLDPNADGGLDNFDQTQPLDENGVWIEPGLILVAEAPEQEVDSVDWDLQSNIKNASKLLSSLVANGGKLENLSLSIDALEINGQVLDVDNFKLGFSTNGAGHNQLVIKNQPAMKDIVAKIVANTESLKSVDLKLHFTNGMAIDLPNGMSVMFNHSVLQKLAK